MRAFLDGGQSVGHDERQWEVGEFGREMGRRR